MRETKVSVAHLTPAIGLLLVEPPLESAPVEVPSLRLAMLVGDALTQRDVARLRERAPAVRVINLYGATETQRAVSWHDGTAEGDPDSRQVLPLGRGMDDVQLLVLNPARQMAGIGELGEIWVRSPHLARGYLEDPERTAERFHVNPFTDDPSDRLYRTGDLGRYRPDGEVSFAGRADQQVKIRGFRVELGEIEAQLLGHPEVNSAAVVLRGTVDGNSTPRLAAFVAGVDGTRPDPASVRDHLVDQLPAYMVPAAIGVLDALPLNPNGKLDRKALPEVPTNQTAGSGSEYVAPRTDSERALALVWGKVLGQKRVGIRDNFFALGGDSLLAIRMVSQAHRQQLAVDAKLLFQYQTIEELAPHTQPAARAAGAMVLAPATSAVPLSQVQRRFFDEVIAGAPEHAHHFNIDRLVVVPPGFDIARLAQAVEVVLQAHDAFALRLIPPHANWLEGDPSEGLRQVRLTPDEAQLHVRLMDLSSLDDGRAGPRDRSRLRTTSAQPPRVWWAVGSRLHLHIRRRSTRAVVTDRAPSLGRRVLVGGGARRRRGRVWPAHASRTRAVAAVDDTVYRVDRAAACSRTLAGLARGAFLLARSALGHGAPATGRPARGRHGDQ